MKNISPITGRPFTEVAKSTPEDVELALDAAHAAKDAWGRPRWPSVPPCSTPSPMSSRPT